MIKLRLKRRAALLASPLGSHQPAGL